MKIRNKQLIILVLLVSAIGCNNIENAKIPNNNFDSLEEKIMKLMDEYNVPSVGVGIIENNEISYIKVFGEIKEGLPAEENTIFSVASLTKPVFTMFVLKLIQTGNWDLDEPISKYWIDPDISGHPYLQKLNTRHILSHQSGFSNWRSQNPEGKLIFNFEPGTDYQYSGEGYEYLRIAIEQKFKQSVTGLIDSTLFSPLKMNNSRLNWDKGMNEESFAYWHDADGKILKFSKPTGDGVGAASTLMTSVGDFCNLGKYTIDMANSTEVLYTEMKSIISPIKKDYGKGLGWEVVEKISENEYALIHSGWNPGVKTMALLLPKSKRGLVVFTNGDNGYNIYNSLIKEVLQEGELLLQKMAGISDRKLIRLEPSDIEVYGGEFLDSYGRKLTVLPIEGGLEVAGEGVPSNSIFPTSSGIFVLKDFDVQFEFSSTNSFKIVVDGKVDCTAKRIK